MKEEIAERIIAYLLDELLEHKTEASFLKGAIRDRQRATDKLAVDQKATPGFKFPDEKSQRAEGGQTPKGWVDWDPAPRGEPYPGDKV